MERKEEIKSKKEELIKLSHLTADEAIEKLESSENGLTAKEADARLEKYGPNSLKKSKTFYPVKQFFKQFVSVMAILLWVAGILAFVAEMPELAIATWAVVIINGLFSFFQEFKADKAAALLSKMMPRKVEVKRDNNVLFIDASELTIGDIILLKAGDSVPADARIISSNNLFLDNSMLSGETIPFNRSELPSAVEDCAISEISNLVYAGTTISQGSCEAIVYAIGNNTQIGEVTSTVQSIKSGAGTLDIKIAKIVRIISVLAMIMSIIVFVLTKFVLNLDRQAGFVFALGILVANIPEGLLPTVNLSLAVGSQRMAKKNALMKRLSSVETLSSATIICTDKTGTLTQNQLMVRKIFTPDSLAEITGEGFHKSGVIKIKNKSTKKGIEKLLVVGIVCSETNIDDNPTDKNQRQVLGSPTEASLLIAATKYGFKIDDVRKDFNILKTNSFTSERKKMSVFVKNISNPYYDKKADYLFVKGAPNIILKDCNVQYKGSHVCPMSEEERNVYLKQNDDFAKEGFRILAMAYKKLKDGYKEEKDMVFLGFAITYDPPRSEIREAVNNIKKAGIKITIITGDYGLTAASIGKQTGIIENDYINLNGPDIDKLSDLELENTLKSDKPIVFSRTTPQHKLRIVEAYKRNGEVVAVTGDGVNDILALKSAQIGIAMGKSGTDVARNAADMILLDDNFATISNAVLEGRGIYENIKKFITYVLSSNVPQLIPILIMVFFEIPPALTVLQILVIDLLTDLLPALALGAEEPEEELMEQKPKSVKENIIDRNLLARSYLFLGLIEAILSFGAFLYIRRTKGYNFIQIGQIGESIINGTASQEIMDIYHYASTMALGGVIFSQVGNVFACRSNNLVFFKTIKKKNNLIYIGIAFEILIFLLIANVGFLQDIFQTTYLEIKDYLILLCFPFVMVLLDTVQKVCKKYMVKKTNKVVD